VDPTLVTNLFGAIGLGAASGLNAWIPLLGLGLADRFGLVTLTGSSDVLGSTPVLVVLAVLLALDVVGDKVPAVDHVLHVVGVVIAPVSGAIVFAAQDNLLSNSSPALAAVAGMVLGGLVHGGRSAFRPAVTATTGGVGNPVVSTVEDVVSTILTVLAVLVPVLAFLFLVAVTVLAVVRVRRWRARRAEARSNHAVRAAGSGPA
jgi:hypothetical protein